ncbi:SDR family oxidoreductase [Nocardia sp. NBC_00508]|uniref:SDR family NAD(P)-dependent oxidoreductase n=1 Tax=Nocardia sp. NBC_00508 TaxID=2975992 RepID=UPI002E8224EE|nr:glucose 1-dehydrogenase [Nocardia sp. NBC_00508]WUD67093.1 SDR family oxidoreductase [Nocardia sp. NBC_00508]
MLRLEGKTALITGGGGGIGAVTAKTYAREGAAVVVVDIDEQAGKSVAAEIKQAGGEAEYFHADLAQPADIEAMIDYARTTYGKLDILHNNAIALAWGRVGELDLEGWRHTIDVGLTAYWYATKVSLPTMMAQGSGVIVNTGSVSALAADYGIAAYNVVKAGVINLTRVTAIEYARRGIRCNAVCPGPIGTPAMLAAENERPAQFGPVKDAIPMGRFGDPQEIANVALFLASDESSFITGAYFVADGGLNAHTHLPGFGNADW